MKKLVLVLLMVCAGFTQAQEKSKNKKVSIEVSGLCDMCKDRIEKAAFKVKGVKSAQWSSETQKLDLILNEKKTDVLTVQKQMASIGHDTKAIQATSEAYDGLHGCCKYERVFGVEKCEANCKKACCKDKEEKKKGCCASTDKKAKTSCSSKK